MLTKRQCAFFLLLLALVVRVAGLDRFPPGLWFDEALNGMDAWAGFHGGGLRLIYPDVFPREPLFLWMLSIALWLFGPHALVMRLVAVGIGSMACVALFGMLLRAEERRGILFALAAGFVLATLHWHAHFSRLVFRTNLVPLLGVCAVWSIAWAASRERRSGWRWMAAGAVAGLGFYSYLAWWFFLPVLAIWLVLLAREGGAGQSARSLGRATAWFLMGLAILVLPLALHYLHVPEDLTGRPEAVSPFAEGPTAASSLIGRNLRDVGLMFSFRGDHVPKHNVPHSPVLDPVWSLFFMVGLLIALRNLLRRSGDPAGHDLAWLAWLTCMSMPSVLSQTDSANTLRNLGATPAVAYFVASGWTECRVRAKRLPGYRQRWVIGFLTAAMIWGGGFQVWKAWVRHPAVPGIANDFNALHVELAALCRPDPSGAFLFVPREFHEHRTFAFLTIGRDDLRPLGLAALLESDPEGRDHRLLCTILSPNAGLLIQAFPRARMESASLSLGDRVFAQILRIPSRDLLPPDEAAALEKHLMEKGFSLER